MTGRVAIVTGAGRGIGRAIACALTREGANIVAVSRTVAEVEATAREARSMGRQARAVRADVSCEADVEAVVAAALEEFGSIDILVNDAGVQGPIGPVADVDRQEWLRAVLVNLGGTFLCTRAVLAEMLRRERGKIINLSGGGATSPRPNFSAYAASKAAVVRFTETVAEEVKICGIQVNAIAPGGINTRMTEAVVSAGLSAGKKALAEARRQKEQGGASVETVAALAVFLASDASNGITGRLISAVWDDWAGMAAQAEEIMSSDLYTLRRIVPSQQA